jgi:hypothetical protein
MGGSLNPRSLAEYTGYLIQASKMLNSTDDATHGVTTGGPNPIRLLYILICCVLLFECVFLTAFWVAKIIQHPCKR